MNLRTQKRFVIILVLGLLTTVRTVAAQPQTPLPGEPLKVWTASASAGLALTEGNADTSTVNAGYEIIYDPKQRNLVKSDGLYLRGRTDGDVTADRIILNGRDEYQLSTRVYAYGQARYLHDRFKEIDYLIAPTGGLGYRLIDVPETKLTVDGGLGGVWEKNPGFDVHASGAVTWGQKLLHQLSETTTLSETLTALYKMDDFDDALYTFDVTLAAAINSRTALKVQFLDVYKNKVTPPLEKTDIAVVVGVVFKN